MRIIVLGIIGGIMGCVIAHTLIAPADAGLSLDICEPVEVSHANKTTTVFDCN